MSTTMSTRIAAGVTADYLRELTRARRAPDSKRDTTMSASTSKRLRTCRRDAGRRGGRRPDPLLSG